MALIGKFCGRKFSHPEHSWKEGVFNLPEARWPMFACAGLTEEEAMNMALQDAKANRENLEETTEDALRRFAGIVAAIEEFINDPDNYKARGFITGDEETDGDALIRVAEIKKIIHPED